MFHSHENFSDTFAGDICGIPGTFGERGADNFTVYSDNTFKGNFTLNQVFTGVLGYGETWSGGGLRCTSAVSGLTCGNKRGHGFFLSRARWRAF